MATTRWEGGALAVAQVDHLTPGGTIEVGDLFKVTLNDKTVTYAATDTTVASVCTGLAAALEASDIPEFTEIAWADATTHVTATAEEAGKPFTLSVATTEAGGGAADAQTFSASTVTDSAGPNHWDTAANWSGGTVPAGGTNEVQQLEITGTPTGGTFTLTFDGQTTAAIAYNASAATVQSALEALSTIGAGNVSCAGGALPGTAVDITFTGDLSNTNVAALTTTDSLTGGTAPASAITTTTPGVAGDSVYVENSAVDILYGLDQSAEHLDLLEIGQTFTGKIGLQEHNGNYYEYRDRWLQVGCKALRIGTGVGSGSGRLKINNGAAKVVSTMDDAGTPEESGLEAVLWQGTNAYNEWNISRGSLGIAPFATDSAAVKTLRLGYRTSVESDVQCRVRAGCTLTTVEKSGGTLDLYTGCTTFTQLAGATTLHLGGVTTLRVRGGTFTYNSTGTLGTATVAGEGVLDFSQDMRPKTVTNPIEKYGDDSRISNPHRVIAGLVVDGNECRTLDGIDGGPNFRITFGTPA